MIARFLPGRRATAALLLVVLSLTAVWVCASWYQTTDANPRADFWGKVRVGVEGYTSVASEAHQILIHNGGQVWREMRNGVIAGIGPWLMAAVLAAIALFYLIVGKDRLEKPRTGRRLERFSLFERVLHWYTAAFFVILALTGLSTLFGRAVMIPVFGQSLFAGYMQWALWVHNVSGPLFLAGLLLEFVIWVKDNIPKKIDLVWFKNLGGMVGKGPHPHAEKVNGGEKAWFWLMVIFGTLAGVTGVVLDFPVFGQSRGTMQISHAVHAIVAILFITASFGHIYIGTIGAEGTFEGMWRGSVDETWAWQHQDLWYEKKMKEKAA